jgi:hypothetical protein
MALRKAWQNIPTFVVSQNSEHIFSVFIWYIRNIASKSNFCENMEIIASKSNYFFHEKLVLTRIPTRMFEFEFGMQGPFWTASTECHIFSLTKLDDYMYVDFDHF